MRITRSTLRRIIAEESARILAETKKHGHRGKRSGEPSEDRDEDQEQSDMDTFMDTGEDPFPFGEPAEDEDDYSYGDDPDEFLDLPAGEIQRRWRDLDEGEGKKRHQSPRDRLAAYLERVGADVDSVMAAVDDAVSRGNEEGSEVSSEDITFNLSDEVLDAIPEDDSDRWHSMLDAVIADEVDLDAFADAEADRQDVEDTQRDLSHPSRFLEEGMGDDTNWDDDLYAQAEYQHALDVGPEVAYADYDTGGRNAFTQRGFKGRGPAPRISGDDFDSGEDEPGGGEAAMADYEHAWNIGGGSDEEGFAADYDTGGRNKFTQMGMRGRDRLSEGRWAKLAGILKG